MIENISHLIQNSLNAGVGSVAALSGGSIASSYRAVMDDGRTFFVKTFPQHSQMFTTEANGLRELQKANAIRIPEVIVATEEILILEYLPVTTPVNRTYFFRQLGKQFAQLHRRTSDQFGFNEDNFIGSTPQKNLPQMSSWNEFFVQNRLEFQFRLAEKNGYINNELRTLFHAVVQLADRLIIHDGERPALLHGDLWSGNYLCLENDVPAIFDPAVYYGHREADLAMTMLFGGFNEHFYSSYQETYPLHDGWEQRCELYKLYHLFNHLNLFGEGYCSQIVETIRSLIR